MFAFSYFLSRYCKKKLWKSQVYHAVVLKVRAGVLLANLGRPLISMQPSKSWVPSTGQVTNKKTPWDIGGKMSPKFASSKVLQCGLIALPQLVLIMLCLHFHYGWIQSTPKTHLNSHQTPQYLLSYHMSNLEWGNQILCVMIFIFSTTEIADFRYHSWQMGKHM